MDNWTAYTFFSVILRLLIPEDVYSLSGDCERAEPTKVDEVLQLG